MAKQLVNPIERHVEKAVLGLTALALLGAIGLYLVSSPNQIELGGQPVKPSTIDQIVAQKASAVRDVILRAPSDIDLPDRLSEEFERGLRPFSVANLAHVWPTAAPLAPDVPLLDAPGVVTGQRDLAKVVTLTDPVLVSGRSTFQMDGLKAVNWVTVSGLFAFKEQMGTLAKEYGAANKDVIFGPVQMQRRARREGGGWSDSDWVSVQPYTTGEVPIPPQINLIPSGDHFSVSRGNQGAVESYIRRLADPLVQLAAIRMIMPSVFNGDAWSLPIITSEHDVLMQDDFYLNPDKPPSASPINRYVDFVAVAVGVAVEETPADLLKRGEELRKSAWQHKSEDEIFQAFNKVLPVEEDKTLGLGIRQRAKTLRIEIERTESDIRRYIARRGAASAAPAAAAFVRTPPAQQQLWVHDALPESVSSGKAYQYRIRATIVNILAGEPDKFRNPQDAAEVFIAGPWTEPIEVTVKSDTFYFLVSEDRRKHEVSVELYRWYDGVWVKARFKHGVGDSLGGQSRCQVPPLEGGAGFETPLVQFAADATVVDIDFKRAYRERKRGTGRSGVQFAPPAAATAVVLVDAEGRLRERFVPTDRGSPEKREILVWKPQKAQP